MNRAVKIGLASFSLILLMFCSALAQMPTSPESHTGDNLLGVKSNAGNFSLLDPSKFRMSHSYSFSYFSSGRTSGSFGVYTNVLEYQVSKPLTLTLSLSYLHQPLSVFGKDQVKIKDAVLPNFHLKYRPSDSFSFTIDVLTFPYPYYQESRNPWLR
jgi:hypothetical protein